MASSGHPIIAASDSAFPRIYKTVSRCLSTSSDGNSEGVLGAASLMDAPGRLNCTLCIARVIRREWDSNAVVELVVLLR